MTLLALLSAVFLATLFSSAVWGFRGALICFLAVPAFAFVGALAKMGDALGKGEGFHNALSTGLFSFASFFAVGGLIVWIVQFAAATLGVRIRGARKRQSKRPSPPAAR